MPFILITIGVTISAIFIFYRLPLNGYFYITSIGDAREQYMHFILQLHDVLYFKESIFYSFQYGVGGSFWNDFGYYVLGDPFAWIMASVPREWMPGLFIPIDIIKLNLMAIGTYLLLRKLGMSRVLSYIGAFSYPFINYHFEYFYTHYFFVNAALYFPWVLYSFERLMIDKKKILFVFFIFISTISNFYFMFMISLGLGFYSIFRYFLSEKWQSWSSLIRYYSSWLFYYFIGLMLSMFIFLPSVISYLKSNATVRHKVEFIHEFSWSEVLDLTTITGGVSFIVLLGLPLLLVNLKKTWPVLGLSLFSICILKTPAFMSALFGFSDPTEIRGFFIIHIFLLISSLYGIQHANWSKWYTYIFLLVGGYSLFQYIEQSNSYPDQEMLIKSLIITSLLITFFFIVKGKTVRRIIGSGIIISVLLYGTLNQYNSITTLINFQKDKNITNNEHKIWGLLPLSTKEEYSNLYQNKTVQSELGKLKNYDDSFYRTVVSYPGIWMPNSSFTYNVNGYTTYQSLVPWSLQEFEMDTLAQPGNRGYNLLRGLGNNTYLTTLLGNKYYLDYQESSYMFDFYGYEKKNIGDKSRFLKNSYWLPMGFVYEKAISEEDFSKEDMILRDRMMFKYAIVDPDDSKLHISKSKQLKSGMTKISQFKNTTLKNNGKPHSFTLPFENKGAGSYYLYLDIKSENPNEGIGADIYYGKKNYTFHKNISGSTYELSQYHYKDTTRKVLIRLGGPRDIKDIRVVLSSGEYKVNSAEVWYDNMEQYKNIVEKHRRNALKDINYNGWTIKGNINVENEGVLFLPIPYSKGWNIYIDGK